MHWFENLKKNPDTLLDTLRRMPKGGDLHTHLTGAGRPQWWYDIALAGGHLDKLSAEEKAEWLTKASVRSHTRPLSKYARAMAEIMYRSMVAYADEGVSYVEYIVNIDKQLIQTLKWRLEQQDAIDTGVTVRLLPTAIITRAGERGVNEKLGEAANIVSDDPVCVGVSLCGREDLMPTKNIIEILDLPFSAHAGEIPVKNNNILDAIDKGADRIGHGLNLQYNADAMLNFTTPIEICMTSNKLLGHINEFSEHPLRLYIQAGIPLMLCTDNPGTTSNTLTDEFYIAVTEFDLSLEEVRELCRNSIRYAFCDESTKATLLQNYESNMQEFIDTESRLLDCTV